MTYREAMKKAAKDYLTDLLQSVNGNIMKAALIAHYDRAHFYVLCRRNGVDWRAIRKPSDVISVRVGLESIP